MNKAVWSIAFPGFGQLLNRQFVKGLLFIFLELLINMESHLNMAILLSFNGKTEMAVEQINYHWLMNYPCFYLFAIYDAYINSDGKKLPYSYIPFILSAFFGTIGVIYSRSFEINNILLGPVLLPIACMVSGGLSGHLISYIIVKYKQGVILYE